MKMNLKLPLRYKYVVTTLALVTLVVSIITLTMANLFHEDKKGYIHDLAVTAAAHTAEETTSILRSYVERLHVFGRFILDRDLAQSKKKKIIENMFTDFPEVFGVTMIDFKGKQATLYDGSLLGKAGLSRKDFVRHREENPLPIEDIHREGVYIENTSLSELLPAMTIALSMTDTDGKPVVISCLIKLDTLLKIANRSQIFDIFIVDGLDNLLSHPDVSLVSGRKKIDWLEDIKEIREKKTLAISKEFEYLGKKMIGGFVPLNFSGLLVVSQIPQSTAYLTTRTLLDSLVGISLMLLVAAVIVSLFWAWRITRPMELLSSAADIVGQGNFDVQVKVSSNDEIGELAGSFNKMSNELKSREQKLQQAQSSLIQSEKMSAFGQLSAGIAHEVKNPLTGILGIAQLAKRKMDEKDPLFEKMQVIEKETKRCKTIIEDLMKFARSEKVDKHPVEVNSVVRDAIKIVNHQLTINRVKIRQSLADGLPEVMAEANQLQQVFMNLMINAQQALKGREGEVSIATSCPDAGHVDILISDTGPGIPEDVVSKIFEPFYTTKPAGEGTGLGLSITYNIIKDHGGNITAANRQDVQGAVFHISLPVAEAADA